MVLLQSCDIRILSLDFLTQGRKEKQEKMAFQVYQEFRDYKAPKDSKETKVWGVIKWGGRVIRENSS